MRLTAKGSYAIQGVLDLAADKTAKPVQLKTIANRQKISLHFLEQIFRKLRISGIVTSVRGPGGGYVLAKDVDAISVKDILSSVGEKTAYVNKKVGSTAQVQTESDVFFSEIDGLIESKMVSTTVGKLLTK